MGVLSGTGIWAVYGYHIYRVAIWGRHAGMMFWASYPVRGGKIRVWHMGQVYGVAIQGIYIGYILGVAKYSLYEGQACGCLIV